VIKEHEQARWRVEWKLEKFREDFNDRSIADDCGHEPYEILSGTENMLVYGGVSNIWQYLIGNGTGTAAQTLTFFNEANAKLGVGDSSTAEAATQTDLQASTNKVRIAMDSGYPQHTPGTTSGAATITFRATADGSTANFAWQEWALFNAATGGRMLNRRVVNLGTKATGTWTLTVTLTLA